MESEFYQKLVERFSECRTAEQCVIFLEDLERVFSTEQELLAKKGLLSLMQSVARLWGDLSREEIFGKTESIIGRLIEADPKDAHSFVVLSEFLFFDREDSERALKTAEDAVSIAKERGDYFNLAAGNLARVATKLERYDLVAFAMEQALERPHMTNVVDTKIETDFVGKLPDGVVPIKLIEDYLCKASK
jgi:hypothetical protein